MSINARRVAAIVRKEFREYLRNRSIVTTMAVLPLMLLIEPLLFIFRLSPSAGAGAVDNAAGAAFLILLITPAIVPAVVAAYSVVGERDQGTLEPLLTTPVRREELLLGKALAIIAPSVIIGYVVFTFVEVAAQLFARNPAVGTALRQGPHVLAEVLFAPLLAAWSTWVGIGISSRSSDARIAQQLGTLASVPPLLVVALMSFNIFTPSIRLAVLFGVVLLFADVVMLRVVSTIFDRERLITGARAQPYVSPATPEPAK